MAKIKAGIPGEHRAKLRMRDPNFSFAGALQPLKEHAGVMFPYTPTITSNFSANYGVYGTTYSIYQQHYYESSPNPTIAIQATFAANTEQEAQYSAACLQFFKTMTKMDFGEKAVNPGAPPHVLWFSAYGDLNYKNIPVVVTSVDYTLSEEYNYVTTTVDGIETTLPTTFMISLTLAVQQTPAHVTKTFSLKQYASGELLRNNTDKNGFI